MKSWRFTLFIFAAVLIVSCLNNDTSPDETELNLLEQQQTDFFEAMSDKDLEGTIRMFSEDAVIQVAGMPQIVGKNAINEFYQNMFGFINSSSASPEAAEISSNGDMAFSRGSTINKFNGAQGSMEYSGKYLLVWKKLKDEWLIVVYSISSDQ